MNYKEEIEKTADEYQSEIEKHAQSRWRRELDKLEAPSDIQNFVSDFNRNNRFSPFGTDGSGNLLSAGKGEITDKTDIKRAISAYSNKETNNIPVSEMNASQRKRRREILEDNLDDRELLGRIAKRNAGKDYLRPDNAYGPMGHQRNGMTMDPEEYVDIISGTNKSRGVGFLQGGNGANKLESKTVLPDGRISDMGMQVHSLNKDRAQGYAEMARASKGGQEAIVKGKIKRKYLYPNANHKNSGDEYGIPKELYHKIKDGRVEDLKGNMLYEKGSPSKAIPMEQPKQLPAIQTPSALAVTNQPKQLATASKSVAPKSGKLGKALGVAGLVGAAGIGAGIYMNHKKKQQKEKEAMDYKEQLEKVAFESSKPLVSNDFQEDNSDRTSLIKDRVMPGIKTKAYGAAGALGAGVIGAGLGLAGKKATRAAYKKVLSSDAGKQIGKTFGSSAMGGHEMYVKGRSIARKLGEPAKFIFGPEMSKARAVTAAGAGALAMAPKGRDAGKIVGNVNALNKQFRNQFGVDASEEEIMRAAKLDPNNKFHNNVKDFFYTPNAVTKSEFREQQQVKNLSDNVSNPALASNEYARSKIASDYISDIEKTAAASIPPMIKRGAGFLGKAIPVAATSVGAMAAGIPSYMATDSFTDSDDENRALKVGGATALGATAGGALGRVIGKDIVDVGRGVADKITHPILAIKQAGKSLSDGRFIMDRAIKAGKTFMTGK